MESSLTETLDGIITPIIDVFAKGLTLIISTRWSGFLIGFLAINVIGFILMKRDKQYAQEGKRRISEFTLLSTAAIGGSLGVYAGMYKFNHKTLHKQFTIFVPVIMLCQVAFITFELITYMIH